LIPWESHIYRRNHIFITQNHLFLYAMPNTFSQIYIQIVFAFKYRKAIIHQSWEDDLYKYITGIIQNKGQKLIAINGMPDHIHIFIGMKPSYNLSD
jgi:putative transposase